MRREKIIKLLQVHVGVWYSGNREQIKNLFSSDSFFIDHFMSFSIFIFIDYLLFGFYHYIKIMFLSWNKSNENDFFFIFSTKINIIWKQMLKSDLSANVNVNPFFGQGKYLPTYLFKIIYQCQNVINWPVARELASERMHLVVKSWLMCTLLRNSI